jgi:TRAP-type C4-dicarboxylate transport system permease small subunit
MRHLFGLVLGVLLAAGALFCAAQGIAVSTTAAQQGRTDDLALAWVVAAGVLVGLLAAGRRLSPLLPFLGGAAFLAVGVLDRVAPSVVGDLGLGRVGQVEEGLRQLGDTGTALLVGIALLLLAVVPQGRRRVRRDEDDEDDDDFTAVPDGRPQAWRAPEPEPRRVPDPGTDAYPAAEPYRRPPLPPS